MTAASKPQCFAGTLTRCGFGVRWEVAAPSRDALPAFPVQNTKVQRTRSFHQRCEPGAASKTRHTLVVRRFGKLSLSRHPVFAVLHLCGVLVRGTRAAYFSVVNLSKRGMANGGCTANRGHGVTDQLNGMSLGEIREIYSKVRQKWEAQTPEQPMFLSDVIYEKSITSEEFALSKINDQYQKRQSKSLRRKCSEDGLQTAHASGFSDAEDESQEDEEDKYVEFCDADEEDVHEERPVGCRGRENALYAAFREKQRRSLASPSPDSVYCSPRTAAALRGDDCLRSNSSGFGR